MRLRIQWGHSWVDDYLLTENSISGEGIEKKEEDFAAEVVVQMESTIQ